MSVGEMRDAVRRDLPLGATLALLALLAAWIVSVSPLASEIAGLRWTLLWLVPLALLTAAAAAFVAFVNPRALLLVAFALLPVVRIEPAPVDIIFALLIAASLFQPLVRPAVPSAIYALVALYGILTVISMLNVQVLSEALRFELITLYLLVLAVWITRVFRDSTLTRLAMKVYILGACASAILGMVALHLGFPGRDFFIYGSEYLEGGEARAQGLFKDPNVFAPYLVPAAVIVLEDIVQPRLLGWRTRWKVVVLAVLGAGIVFAFSRAAWLNLGIAVATLIVVYAWRRGGLAQVMRLLVPVIAVVVVGVALLAWTGSTSFLEERSGIQSYDVGRFATQGAAFDAATERVFGHGPGETKTLLVRATHSIFARAAFEQGIPGLLVLSALLVATIYCGIVLAARRRHVDGIGTAALLGAWLGIFANGFFVDTLHWRHLWLVAALIWFGTAMLARADDAPRAEVVADPAGRRPRGSPRQPAVGSRGGARPAGAG